MAKNIQNLIKLSSVMRGFSLMTCRSMTVRSYQTSSQLYTINEKRDAIQFYMSETSSPSSKKNVRVSRILDEYKSNADVFHVIQTEKKKIDGLQAIKLLEGLFVLNKSKKDRDSIRQKKEFSFICEILKRDVRQLTDGKAISALKFLNYFQIPTTTVVVQMLLQMIRQTINSLTLDQIIFLDFLLRKCQKTPLVEALSIALPIVFDTHVKTHLDMDNLESLVGALEYMRRSSSFSDAMPTVLRALSKIDASNISEKMAKKMSFIFLTLPLIKSNHYEKSVKNVLSILSNSTNNLNSSEVSAIIHKIVIKQTTKEPNSEIFYNENLIDGCAMAIVSKDMGFDSAIEALKNLTQIPYVNIQLLDYIASKCYEDIRILKKANHRDIDTLIFALALADYKPVFWDTIKEHLYKKELLNDTPARLIKLAINLAVLDCFWPKLLEKVFTDHDLEKRSAKKKLLLLNEIVKMNYPEYNGTVLTDKYLKLLNESISYDRDDHPLKAALEVVTGGEQYIITNRRTKLGYFIDHVVIMRKGGFPIAINSIDEPFPNTIEDVTAIPDSQVILFMYIPFYGYIKNTEQLTGFWTFLLKTIKAETKHTIIPIHSKMWKELSESEQVRYMSKALRLESDELSAIPNI